jgi:cold shock CspA family protein
MFAGVIRDIDVKGCFGLIELDEGDIVIFGRDSLRANFEPHALHVGQRVEFTIDVSSHVRRGLVARFM